MGSASSKDHDANPHNLGTDASGEERRGSQSGQYPMQHHPHYGHSGAAVPPGSDGNMYTSSGYPPPESQSLYQGERGAGAGSSDAMEVDQTAEPLAFGGGVTATPASSSGNPPTMAATKNDVVPMVFRWEHGGRNVYITGTFNGWSKQCPMHRSGNDFTYIANLTRGKHAYKFVVDDEWRFAPDQLTVADVEGNVNNFVDVSEFQPLSDFDFVDNKDNDENSYGRFIPDIDEYTKEPPPLPPHLRHIILNKNPPSVDNRLLPVPQHVALNHLYCTAIKDGMMVLGVTQRYKQKFVTTVYYSLMPGTT
ncbi:hypothetical protein Poli38472_001405 [Pythium oligandrum]|uniref:Association with the SNF1 complex (ASC) domain-containing protein n=1 Tax=Pythium oligandrum TaxID=41045 RepID=A0A8K1CTG3_PYTOL|nr:hypothetical protein Poli38472_001405 [Pythium oligandrum]|eukprot:TMW69249.1 hypothetical protein Poli38472_001405 [Pythium oligandrum]